MVWVEFAFCGLLMVTSAYALCKAGMLLAEVTHIEEGVIGIFFLAIATSFPEIVVGVSSVSCFGSIALGYGDLVGSVMINSMLLVGVDYFAGRGRVFFNASRINFITVLFWLAVASVFVLASILRKFYDLPSFGPFGVESLVVLGLYLAYIGKLKKKNPFPGISVSHDLAVLSQERSWKRISYVWIKFLFLLLAVMFLGVWMAELGASIAEITGLSQTFVGGTLLALITSFPEIAVTFTAMKAGSVEMALGNVLGSNLFDLTIVSFLDIFTKNPIVAYFTPGQILLTAMAALVPFILLVGMKYRINTNKRIGMDTALVFFLGMVSLVVLYLVD